MYGNQSNPNQRYAGYYKESGDPGQDASNSGMIPIQHDMCVGGEGDMNRTNLIVNYLPQYMTDKDLYTMFVSQGPLENVRIMKDYKTGYSYGFGFVKFVNPDDAARAISTLNGVEYYNKRLKVSYARPPGQNIKDSNLYVTNLPKNITEMDIDNLFGEFGDIVQKNILKDKITGMPRGVAFVRYARRDEAHSAIQKLNGKFLEGCIEPLCVKIAEEHGRQKATYYEGFKAGYQMNKGFRQLRGHQVRRGIPTLTTARGAYQYPIIGAGGGGGVRPHRYNPLSMGAGDIAYTLMNTY